MQPIVRIGNQKAVSHERGGLRVTVVRTQTGYDYRVALQLSGVIVDSGTFGSLEEAEWFLNGMGELPKRA